MLTTVEKNDRQLYWGYYCGGIDCLAWRVVSTYRHHFGNATEWTEAQVTVYDFDSFTSNDYLGRIVVPLATGSVTKEVTVPLLDSSSKPVRAQGQTATITYSLEWRDFPSSSRLKGCWRIRIVNAQNLQVSDLMTQSSDPFVSVVAVAGDLRFEQNSSIVARNMNPEWNETFEVPIAATGSDLLQEALAREGISFKDQENLSDFLPADWSSNGETALQAWRNHLTQTIKT